MRFLCCKLLLLLIKYVNMFLINRKLFLKLLHLQPQLLLLHLLFILFLLFFSFLTLFPFFLFLIPFLFLRLFKVAILFLLTLFLFLFLSLLFFSFSSFFFGRFMIILGIFSNTITEKTFYPTYQIAKELGFLLGLYLMQVTFFNLDLEELSHLFFHL